LTPLCRCDGRTVEHDLVIESLSPAELAQGKVSFVATTRSGGGWCRPATTACSLVKAPMEASYTYCCDELPPRCLWSHTSPTRLRTQMTSHPIRSTGRGSHFGMGDGSVKFGIESM